MAVELAVPFVASKTVGGTPRNVSHLAERYGLFVMIVLGEAVYGVIVGLSRAHVGAGHSLVAALCFVVAAGMWWVYFNLVDPSRIRSGFATLQAFTFSHLGIALGIAVAGPGAALVIERSGRPAVGLIPALAMAGGYSLFLACCAAVRAASLGRQDRTMRLRLLAALPAVGLAVTGRWLSALDLAVTLALFLVVLVASEVQGLATADRHGASGVADAGPGSQAPAKPARLLWPCAATSWRLFRHAPAGGVLGMIKTDPGWVSLAWAGMRHR